MCMHKSIYMVDFTFCHLHHSSTWFKVVQILGWTHFNLTVTPCTNHNNLWSVFVGDPLYHSSTWMNIYNVYRKWCCSTRGSTKSLQGVSILLPSFCPGISSPWNSTLTVCSRGVDISLKEKFHQRLKIKILSLNLNPFGNRLRKAFAVSVGHTQCSIILFINQWKNST